MFSKKKRWVAVLCLGACLTGFSLPQVMATDIDTNSGYTEIMPMMEYISYTDCDFSISNGKAKMYAEVEGLSQKATKCEVTIELQEKGLFFWDTVNTWKNTQSGILAELNVSYKVTAGKNIGWL